MTMKCTLTPNRSTGPRRGVRIIMYRRYRESEAGSHRDHVVPFLATMDEAGRTNVEETSYSKIRESAVDPEFATAWAEHVRYQAALGRDHTP